MSRLTHASFGLQSVLETLETRFEYDDAARIVGRSGGSAEGVLPRFVLGRAPEGVVWRFRADLPADLIRSVARLVGRETGFPIDPDRPPVVPERLVMIERALSGGDAEEARRVETRHEWVTRQGVTAGEIWTLP